MDNRFPDLPPGIYEIKLHAECLPHIMVEGFSPDNRVFVHLCCGKRIRLNVRLRIPAGIIDYVGGKVLLQNLIDWNTAIRYCVTSER